MPEQKAGMGQKEATSAKSVQQREDQLWRHKLDTKRPQHTLFRSKWKTPSESGYHNCAGFQLSVWFWP